MMSGAGGRGGRRRLRRRGDEEADEDVQVLDDPQPPGVSAQEQMENNQLDQRLQEIGFDIDPDMSLAEKRDLLQALVASNEDYKKEENLRELELAQSQLEDEPQMTEDEDEVTSRDPPEENAEKASDVINLDDVTGDELELVEDRETKREAQSNSRRKTIEGSKKKKIPSRLLELSFPSDSDSASDLRSVRQRASTPEPSTSREIIKRKRGKVIVELYLAPVDSGEEFKSTAHSRRGRGTNNATAGSSDATSVVPDTVEDSLSVIEGKSHVTKPSSGKQGGLPPRKKRRCMQIGNADESGGQHTSQTLEEPPELTEDDSSEKVIDDHIPEKVTRDVEIQQSFGEDEDSDGDVKLITESDVPDSDDSTIFDLPADVSHQGKTKGSQDPMEMSVEASPADVHSPQVSPIREVRASTGRFSHGADTPSPSRRPKFTCSAHSTPELDMTTSPVLTGRRVNRTSVVPPTPEETDNKSSRRSLEFDVDETQDPNEVAPSPDATIEEEEDVVVPSPEDANGCRQKSIPPPGATLDIDDPQMSESQDLFESHLPNANKAPSSRKHDPYEQTTQPLNSDEEQSYNPPRKNESKHQASVSSSGLSDKEVYVPKEHDFTLGSEDEIQIPQSSPRKLPRRFKRHLEDRNPYYAPKNVCPREYAAQIVAYFEQYRRVLHSVQSRVCYQLAWGPPVTAGRHMSRTIDFLPRGRVDHTIATSQPRPISPKCTQYDLVDSSDEEEFVPKRLVQTNLKNMRQRLPRNTHSTVRGAGENFDDDDFVSASKSYGKKQHVEPSEKSHSPSASTSKANAVGSHRMIRTVPAAQSSPVPSSAQSAVEKFDLLFSKNAKPKITHTYSRNSFTFGPPAETLDRKSVMIDSSQENIDDYFANEESVSSHPKVGELFAEEQHDAINVASDVPSPIVARHKEPLKKVVQGRRKSRTKSDSGTAANDTAPMETSTVGDGDVTDELQLHISASQDVETTMDSDTVNDPSSENEADCEESYDSAADQRPLRQRSARKPKTNDLRRKVIVRGQVVEKDVLCTTMSPQGSEPKMFESFTEDQDESRLEILNLSDEDAPMEVHYHPSKKSQQKPKQSSSPQFDPDSHNAGDGPVARNVTGRKRRRTERRGSQEHEEQEAEAAAHARERDDTQRGVAATRRRSNVMNEETVTDDRGTLDSAESAEEALPPETRAVNVAIALPLLQEPVPVADAEKPVGVECPICSRYFSKEEVEQHANICIETMMAEQVAREMSPPRDVVPRARRNRVNSPAPREPIRQHQAANQDGTVPTRGTRRRGHTVEEISVEDIHSNQIRKTPSTARKRNKYVSLLDEEPARETPSVDESDDFENMDSSMESTSSGSRSSGDDDENVPLSSRQQEPRDSPIRLHFQPISQQNDGLFDYQNQFRRKVRDPKRFNRASKPKKRTKKRKSTKKKKTTTAKRPPATSKSSTTKKSTSNQPVVHIA